MNTLSLFWCYSPWCFPFILFILMLLLVFIIAAGSLVFGGQGNNSTINGKWVDLFLYNQFSGVTFNKNHILLNVSQSPLCLILCQKHFWRTTTALLESWRWGMRVFADAPNGHLFRSLWGKLFAGRRTAEMLGVAPGRMDSSPPVPPNWHSSPGWGQRVL